MPFIQYVNLGQEITIKNSSNFKEGKIMNKSKTIVDFILCSTQNFRHKNL